MRNDILKILINEEEINQSCQKLGEQITKDYNNKQLVLVGLLKGCQPFLGDLSKRIDTHLEIAYMRASSYTKKERSKEITLLKDPTISIENKHVLIVEDIVDSALTVQKVIKEFKKLKPLSVEVVTLIDKPSGRLIDFVPKYVGHIVPNEFVVGYGLDYNEYYRNLPFVGILKQKIYKGE